MRRLFKQSSNWIRYN